MEMEKIAGIIEVTDANFKAEVLDSERAVLVDFWAPWCMPCQIIAPAVKEIAKDYKDSLKVCKVNVDEAPEAATSLGIRGIPTLAVFKKGEVVDRIVGAVPKEEIERAIRPHI